MATPFDRVFLGDVVTSSEILRDGYVAVRGETIAAIGRGAPPPAGALRHPSLRAARRQGAPSVSQPGAAAAACFPGTKKNPRKKRGGDGGGEGGSAEGAGPPAV